MKLLLLSCLLAIAACSERDRPAPPATRPQQPPRAIIAPPSGSVRPLPPHAIRADGVGPYKLGDKVATVLHQLPSGPRILRFQIPGIVQTGLIRAEDDTVLIGGETGGTSTFVAVVGPEVAFTEGGVHVGSKLDDLMQALGPSVEELDRARDPRLAVPSKLRNARAIVERDAIRAIVVTPEVAPSGVEASGCDRPSANGRAFGTCLGAGERVEVTDDEVVIRPVEPERAIPWRVRAPNTVFAAPLRNLADGRDELVVITRLDDDQHRRWSIAAYRLEGGRMVRAVELPAILYQLSASQTRMMIGAELKDVDLYLELTSRPDGIEVGGLLTTRAGEKIRDVAVISPILVARRHGGKSAPPETSDASDAGVPTSVRDAGTQIDALAGAGSANP